MTWDAEYGYDDTVDKRHMPAVEARMNTVLRGVVDGNTIKLTQPAGLADGREVSLMLVDGAQSNGSGSENDERFPMPEGMQIARTAFLRDLPTLLADKKCAGKWVLYHRASRIRTARTQQELVRHCRARGWDAGDCYIDMAIPHPSRLP